MFTSSYFFVSLDLVASFQSQNLAKFHDTAPVISLECFQVSHFHLQILFDNSNHNGRVPVTVGADGTIIDCRGNSSLRVTPGE